MDCVRRLAPTLAVGLQALVTAAQARLAQRLSRTNRKPLNCQQVLLGKKLR